MFLKRDLRRTLLGAALSVGVVGAGGALASESTGVDSTGFQTPQYAVRRPLSASDAEALGHALEAARLGDPVPIRRALDEISDPLARKIALWALVDTGAAGLGYAEVDGARRDLAGWPGAAKRVAATERALDGGGLRPQSVIDWFAGADPATPEGAMALAGAYQAAAVCPRQIRRANR